MFTCGVGHPPIFVNLIYAKSSHVPSSPPARYLETNVWRGFGLRWGNTATSYIIDDAKIWRRKPYLFPLLLHPYHVVVFV